MRYVLVMLGSLVGLVIVAYLLVRHTYTFQTSLRSNLEYV